MSARSATTGGGNALVTNCAAERSGAIVSRGRSPLGQLGNGATRCQSTGHRGADARGNEVPNNGATKCQRTGQRCANSHELEGRIARTGVETGVQNTGALERCWGAEHCWGSRHCGGAGDWRAGLSRTGVETGVQNTGALERCWGAEHYWGSRHCGGAGDAGAS